MTSKGAKETIVTKLGFRSGGSTSKVEAELERVRKENGHLKRKIDELTKQHIRPPDSDKSNLLERIISLETLREKNSQMLLVKEQELESLRQQLTARGGEVVVSLQAQLEQRRKDADQKDMLFQNLSQETENLKNKLAAVSARCQTLESQVVNGLLPPGDLALVQDQLRDALEKNQQWLVYDQQREAYVRSVLVRTHELEQQLSQSKEEQPNQEICTACSEKAAQLKTHYSQMTMNLQRDLDTQKDQTLKTQNELQSQLMQVSKLQEEVSALQRRYEVKCGELSSCMRKYNEKCIELDEMKMQLQRLNSRHVGCEERQMIEQADRFRAEMENMEIRLEEERQRSSDLLLQVNVLQNSLLSQNEEQRRIAALEQQINLSTKDFENEKLDRQTMQYQLHKVLKELRKARDQIAKLESAKQANTRFSEPSSNNRLDFERLTIDDPSCPLTSPSKVNNALDESFLECPKCQVSYPTSRHRELLAHIDYCLA